LEGGVECDTTQSKGGRKTGGKGGGFTYDEIPWGEIFSNPVSLTLFLNMFSYGWIGYMVLTELPSYLTDVLGGYHTTLQLYNNCSQEYIIYILLQQYCMP
jgi:hypothetical protein